MFIEVPVKVSKDANEIGVLLKNVILAIKAKKPTMQIVAEEFKDLTTAIEGMDNLGPDAKADMAAFVNGFVLPVEEAALQFLAPAPAAATP